MTGCSFSRYLDRARAVILYYAALISVYCVCLCLVWKSNTGTIAPWHCSLFPSYLSVPSCWKLWPVKLELAYRRHQNSRPIFGTSFVPGSSTLAQSHCALSAGDKPICPKGCMKFGDEYHGNSVIGSSAEIRFPFLSQAKEPINLVHNTIHGHGAQLIFSAPEFTPPKPATWLEKKAKTQRLAMFTIGWAMGNSGMIHSPNTVHRNKSLSSLFSVSVMFTMEYCVAFWANRILHIGGWPKSRQLSVVEVCFLQLKNLAAIRCLSLR